MEDLEIFSVFLISFCWVLELRKCKVVKICRDIGRLIDCWVGFFKWFLIKLMMEMMDCLFN